MRHRSFTFLVGLVTLACRGANGSTAGASPQPTALDAGRPQATIRNTRVVLLGRLVELPELRVIRTLTDAPDSELTAVTDDVGVVVLRDWKIRAFRLSTGDLLWEHTPDAPCRSLVPAGSRIYAGCGNKVLSYSAGSGEAHVVDRGPHAMDPVLVGSGSLIASPHSDGRVSLYDAGDGKLRATKVLPELGRAFHRYVLTNPASKGVCVLGLVAGSATRMTYRAGCYDERLSPRWTRSLPMSAPRDAIYDVRQNGPERLVLDDQYSILDPSLPPGPGRGVVLRWRDGEVTRFDDKTFATVEGADGKPLHLDLDVFERTESLPRDHEGPPLRQAKIAGDDRRVFALIVNGSTGLAGVDRATGHVLFLVPVPLGSVWGLDVASGMPVVRTRFADHWAVTVHDPTTGVVAYRDTRPLAPNR